MTTTNKPRPTVRFFRKRDGATTMMGERAAAPLADLERRARMGLVQHA